MIRLNQLTLLPAATKLSRLQLVAVAVACSVLGTIVLLMARAAGPLAAVEPETGTLSAGATVQSTTGASGSGVVRFAATTPTPAPTATPSSSPAACAGAVHTPGGSDAGGGCWPGAANTGIPAGTTLTTYTGPCTITTAGAIIDGKTVNCDLTIAAANVMIKNSKVNGVVFLDTDNAGSAGWSFTIQDAEVDGGQQQHPAVGWGNLRLVRANIHGGITSAQCEEKSVSCVIQDSYLHGQYIQPNSNWHLGGFLSDGGGPISISHSTVACDQTATYGSDGGCTGDINLIPNFATAHDVTIHHNLLPASLSLAFCTYAGDRHDGAYPYGNHIVYTDNIFQRGSNGKCGAYGPVAGWGTGTGNTWTNNKWTDGADVIPEY
jgi:hypothetical protein